MQKARTPTKAVEPVDGTGSAVPSTALVVSQAAPVVLLKKTELARQSNDVLLAKTRKWFELIAAKVVGSVGTAVGGIAYFDPSLLPHIQHSYVLLGGGSALLLGEAAWKLMRPSIMGMAQFLSKQAQKGPGEDEPE